MIFIERLMRGLLITEAHVMRVLPPWWPSNNTIIHVYIQVFPS